ncbi:hypothetical protein EWM64_g10945 [Hericium alpestre]|uniref:Protein kinase domain-containing protein n=1 Tax=Hericium alpestre TaxID=135208 RepID=A0A4Y9ZGB4_9AGAM|nr:hypothetical protein EWM64_g10945 [Hericium alpestre]
MEGLRYPKVAGYRLVQKVGHGGFSCVFQAIHVEEHRVAACKVVTLTESTTQAERKTLDKEMRVHAALKNLHVLEFINAVIVEPGTSSSYFPAIYMLLEFAAGGDLFDKIAPDVGIADDVAHYYFRQLIEGLNYIHERCGSLPYVAPELAGNSAYQAEPVDVWGIGIILFTMLIGNTPWDEPTHRSYEYQRYLSKEIFDDDPWKGIGPSCLSLITRLLDINPSKRMTLAEALSHPWVLRQSQLDNRGPVVLAEQLTQSLRENGDLAIANPSLNACVPPYTFLYALTCPRSDVDMDQDEDAQMISATSGSQFTQKLLLFVRLPFPSSSTY